MNRMSVAICSILAAKVSVGGSEGILLSTMTAVKCCWLFFASIALVIMGGSKMVFRMWRSQAGFCNVLHKTCSGVKVPGRQVCENCGWR